MKNRRLEKRRRKALLQIYHAKGILANAIKDFESFASSRKMSEAEHARVKKELASNPKEKQRRKLLLYYRNLGGDARVFDGSSPVLERLAFNVTSLREEIFRLENGEWPVPLAKIHVGGREELTERWPTRTEPYDSAKYNDKERPIRHYVVLHNFAWINGKLDVEIKGSYGEKSRYGEGPKSLYGLSDTETEIPLGGTGASPLFRNVWARRGK